MLQRISRFRDITQKPVISNDVCYYYKVNILEIVPS